MLPRLVCLNLLLIALAGTVSAQVITIRTVPVSIDDQFQIFPSARYGMAGVSLALPDTLLDPFGNPAKGSRIRAAQFFGTPTFYSVSKNAGSGRTLPLGMLGRRGAWFGGVWAALQQVDRAIGDLGLLPTLDARLSVQQPGIVDPDGLLIGLDERTHGNQFAFGSLGKVLPSGVAVGGSVSWAGLHAIDGVDLLYANSAGVRQFGHSLDMRVGAFKEWGQGYAIDAVLVYNRFRMTHDVTQLDFFWDPGIQQAAQRTRLERNLDHTDTYGLHVQYERPIADSAWRIGYVATVNGKSHPKIPNYEIMSIPRDPGGSAAFNFGVGVAKTQAGVTFGLDVIYEPIWSHTWADAATPVLNVSGDTIPVGGMTIENHFRFSNALVRLGVSRDFGVPNGNENTIQFGLIVRSISYGLDQQDHVRLSQRRLDESWVEWTPTWGLRLGFAGLEIRYQGRLTQGTGRPGVSIGGGGIRDFAAAPASGGGIIVAPSGPLTLGDVRILTHQLSVSLPLR
jgi:hypothetical protein